MTNWNISGPDFEATWLVVTNLGRLTLAAILGGCIGLEREFKRKPAGLRTNMFICLGAALFTMLSRQIAGDFDHARIAAQIIPGIGFIGAGSIMRSRGSVQGLTTAATIFVVAAIGMATGAGLYLTALFTTLIVIFLLLILGSLEERFKTKSPAMTYEIIGNDAGALIAEVNSVLESMQQVMGDIRITRHNSHYRLQFAVNIAPGDRQDLIARLRALTGVSSVNSFPSPERE